MHAITAMCVRGPWSPMVKLDSPGGVSRIQASYIFLTGMAYTSSLARRNDRRHLGHSWKPRRPTKTEKSLRSRRKARSEFLISYQRRRRSFYWRCWRLRLQWITFTPADEYSLCAMVPFQRRHGDLKSPSLCTRKTCVVLNESVFYRSVSTSPFQVSTAYEIGQSGLFRYTKTLSADAIHHFPYSGLEASISQCQWCISPYSRFIPYFRTSFKKIFPTTLLKRNHFIRQIFQNFQWPLVSHWL